VHRTEISQQTMNANELYSKALPGSCWFRICSIILCRLSPREPSSSLTNRQTDKQTNKHTDSQLYRLVYTDTRYWHSSADTRFI